MSASEQAKLPGDGLASPLPDELPVRQRTGSGSSTGSVGSLKSPRVLLPKQPTPRGDADPDTPLPPGWAREVDKRSGRLFFVNHSLKKWSWTPPPAVHQIEAGD
ncbi:hypothetical protein T484DRAFT_1919724 [Baffinella frigidus]|nr:hypothetical protein T484DRAFT_1919724 [Cryptophyta sp. CCMP2293]